MSYFISKLISLIRGERYVIKHELDLSSVLIVLVQRFFTLLVGTGWQVIRFRSLKLFFKSSSSKIMFSKQFTFEGPLTIGRNVVVDCLSLEGVKLGKNVSIPDNTYIRCTGVISELGKGLSIGDNTGLGHSCFINAQGGVVIENDVIVGPGVKILSENHNFENINLSIRLQGVNRKGIIVKRNVWLGADVTILDGVEIGEGSIIGAGSIVTKSLPPFSIAFGNPCKVHKVRT